MISIEDQLKKILGATYGGPSISFQNGEFVLYEWSDAPVSTDILAKGKTLQELINNYNSNKKN